MTVYPRLLTWLCLLQITSAASPQNCTLNDISPSKELSWCPCYGEFFCARLEVPLDYQNPNLGHASVPIIKLPAKSDSTFGPYQGMILLNPGGPGASGVSEAQGNATTIQRQNIVGSNWDIVGFDPRGMWQSLPVASCSSDLAAIQNTGLISRLVPSVTDDYYEEYINYGKELGKQCQEKIGGEMEAGPHMSTATTARDMLSIVDAFAETKDGQRASKPNRLLNYYGISYGSFLGQTFASMFPERVGNFVVDGIVSPEGYLTNWTTESVTHLDGVIAAFFIYCHEAGQSACAYSTGSTPKDIFDRFNRSFVQLDPHKAEGEGWHNATDLESALVVLKVGLLTVADTPFSYFGILPDVLLGLERALSAQDIGPWVDEAKKIFGDPGLSAYTNPEWTLGVLCSDQGNRWYNKTLENLRPLIAGLDSQSIIGGVWIRAMLGCTGWPIKAVERYTGPFGGDTATPILFVSNTYDPVTPIENSFSSAPKYKGAQVLTIDGMGHTTSASQNICAYAKISAYFQTGQMPGNDSFCKLEKGPFGILLNGTLQENIMKAGLSDLIH